MPGPLFLTLTGVDEQTSIDTMDSLTDEFPFVEWAALVRLPPLGQPLARRYPSLPWLHAMCAHAMARRLPWALHFCGAAANSLLVADPDCATTATLMSLVCRADRIQLNLCGGAELAPAVLRLAHQLRSLEHPVRLILPWNARTQGLWAALADAGPGLDCLVDASGGRGTQPKAWPAPGLPPSVRTGYAGGISAKNLQATIQSLHSAGSSYWLNIEASLRKGDDAFDLSSCAELLRQLNNLRISS
jgi:hypothetical protein